MLCLWRLLNTTFLLIIISCVGVLKLLNSLMHWILPARVDRSWKEIKQICFAVNKTVIVIIDHDIKREEQIKIKQMKCVLFIHFSVHKTTALFSFFHKIFPMLGISIYNRSPPKLGWQRKLLRFYKRYHSSINLHDNFSSDILKSD